MNEHCTKDKASALSRDELDELLKRCHAISRPLPEAEDENESPPTATAAASAADKDEASINDRDVIVIPNLASLSKLPVKGINNDRLFVAVDRESTLQLHESKSISIESNDNHQSHYYYIDNNESLKLKSLCVTVVFSGVFDGSEYQAGKIDVILRRLSTGREPIVTTPILTKTFRSQNSIDSIGLITIDHDLENKVIASGLIELIVTAEATSSYSIALSGNFARRVELEVKQQAVELQEKKQRIDKLKSKHQSLIYLQQLLERKIKVVEDLHAKDRVSLDNCLKKVDHLEDELDHSNGTEDEDTFLLRKIKALSIEHKHFISRIRCKGDVRKDLQSKLEGVKEIDHILKDVARLVKEVGEGNAILSSAYTRLGLEEVEV